MAAPASEHQWRRRPWRRDDDDDLDDDDEQRVMEEEEEGEVVRGCCSESETDTDEYYNRHSPSESDDVVSGRRAASSLVVAANNGRNAGTSCVAQRWGGTGKRGRPPGSGTGAVGVSVSPSAKPDHQSTAVVAAATTKAVLQPVPLAFAPPSSLPSSSVPTASAAARTNLSGESSSSAQSLQNDEVMETAVVLAGAARPRAEAAVHQQPVAPPPPPRPAPAAAAAGRQNPDGYTCPKCGMWFATHQGLGGHIVGHKHRERELLLAVAVPGGRDGAKRERAHVCSDCGAEFATGVQLGGHKRKHWAGAPIVPKKKPRAAVVVLDQPLPPPARAPDIVTLAVKADATSPAAVTTTTLPAARSPVAGRLRLFGVDIGPAVQTPEARQGFPASATQSLGSTVVQQ